jgi:hypothetical protein
MIQTNPNDESPLNNSVRAFKYSYNATAAVSSPVVFTPDSDISGTLRVLYGYNHSSKIDMLSITIKSFSVAYLTSSTSNQASYVAVAHNPTYLTLLGKTTDPNGYAFVPLYRSEAVTTVYSSVVWESTTFLYNIVPGTIYGNITFQFILTGVGGTAISNADVCQMEMELIEYVSAF